MRVAGIMSGTSLDGVDVAVVEILRSRFDVVVHRTFPYPKTLRSRILAVSNAPCHTAEFSRLNFLLPEIYAKAVKNCGVPLKTIDLIGCHGQTIFHEKGSTLQIGDGSILAERTGVPVVSDFRPRDMAAGGRGAPLVPFVDYLLYRNKKFGRVALNIGGIANVTSIPAGGAEQDVLAFDTGPGNMVIDQLVNVLTGGRKNYDDGGRLGRCGTVDVQLLQRLCAAPYYRQKPPKTVGREQYGAEFVADLIKTGIPMLDLIATSTALTAKTVAIGIQRHLPTRMDELFVSGGGAHNLFLMEALQEALPYARVATSAEVGIDVDAKEAIAFAILAHRTWKRLPSNLPSATGATRSVILGKVSY
jgi:anhydro-N-acetylmuramic acid kinase